MLYAIGKTFLHAGLTVWWKLFPAIKDNSDTDNYTGILFKMLYRGSSEREPQLLLDFRQYDSVFCLVFAC